MPLFTRDREMGCDDVTKNAGEKSKWDETRVGGNGHDVTMVLNGTKDQWLMLCDMRRLEEVRQICHLQFSHFEIFMTEAAEM